MPGGDEVGGQHETPPPSLVSEVRGRCAARAVGPRRGQTVGVQLGHIRVLWDGSAGLWERSDRVRGMTHGPRPDGDAPRAKIASTDAWRARADDDPWYAVASHAGKEGRGWDRDEFYALGASDWADFLAQWQRYADPRGTCLEIGAGAGRMTKPLASHFDHVIGTDVSDTMLALAREAVPNAEFRAVEGTELPLEADSVDAVFTAHVLQHFETSHDVTALLRESQRVLRPGGTIMAHMLLRVAAEESLTSWLKKTKQDAARRITRYSTPKTVARRYMPDQVRAMFEDAGFVAVELREFRVSSNSDPHPFWFGRVEQPN